ncbi:MAG: histidine kinase [Gemmatimonadetes bacterium]|jgi:two-component system sensor histidine kinase AlgZ|nr:histidine kinase [Gemmatimonadota bacterium]MBK9976384.1 histidine kinase [Gemmatimonadota bacterium]
MTSSRTPLIRVLGTGMGVWATVLVLHVAAAYSDMLRRGAPVTLRELLGAYLVAYLPWVAYTTVLYGAMDRRRAVLSERRFVAQWYVASLVFYLVPEVAWQVAAATLRNAPDPLSAFLPAFRRWPAELWLLDLALMTGSFVAIYALVAMREARALRERQRADEAERLTLRLELEQQRLRGIRAQLEPHFLFNALSAIAGLVRNNDQRVAIDAIGQLSAQLRHAITASQKDWSTIGEELQFVRGYVALQALRYPERLRVTVDAPAAAESFPCPPLLLQPLVENAIRHDLECHQDISTIDVAVTPGPAGTTITVRNSMHPGSPANPGLGLGLRGTRDRLALLYGEAARVEAGPADAHFVVTIFLPLVAKHDS